MILYSYFRSSASYRVRIALALKGIHPDETHYVNLRDGMQRGAEYREMNPQGLVPAIALDGGTVISQSLAIMEYLDEAYPDAPKLLPTDALGRARVRSLANYIASEMQPLGNLRVVQHLGSALGQSEEQRTAWIQHWYGIGLQALEESLSGNLNTGIFCHGDTPGMADCCLVPQVFAALRFGMELSRYPTVQRIYDAMLALPQIQPALPANQPDAVA